MNNQTPGLTTNIARSELNKEIFTPIFQQPQNESGMPEFQENMVQNVVYDAEITKMNSEDILKYLQMAMKMPNSLDKFINSADAKNLKILVENLIDTKILGDYLNKNSNLAMDKILKAIAESSRSGARDVSQLKDIFNIITTIQNQTNLSSNALKELLLLYIPLNPMIFEEQINFSPASNEIAEEISNSTLSIIFETINFSNILCCLNEAEGKYYINLYVDKSFPVERFTKVIETVTKEINLNTSLEVIYSRKINKNEPQKIKNFKIISSGYIPSNVLILANLIIKTVFKADETFSE